MIKAFRQWLIERKRIHAARQYESGYNYAAGALLATNGTYNPLDEEPTEREFDAGIREACLDWIASGRGLA